MSRVSVLFVVTSTVAPLASIDTVADGENVGVPNEYPIGGVGGVSLTVQLVPVGMPDTVWKLPAAIETVPSWALPSLQS